MKMRFVNKAEFDAFKNEISVRLGARSIRHINIDSRRSSAVNMLLLNKENEPHVFLTKRSADLPHHKGQVAFPGGGFDETDGSILETAMRETFEETGIEPREIETLGRFDDFITASGYHVACFVGALSYPFKYKLNGGEVDKCFEAPMRIFANREYSKLEKAEIAGKTVTVYHYQYMDNDIWGLTARILTDFSVKILMGELNAPD
jgi:8-oxo-dGTP pyrophosphatase MutT (NUDIX family)